MKKTLIVSLDYPPNIGGVASYVHGIANAMHKIDKDKVIVYAPKQKNTGEWDQSVAYELYRDEPYYKLIWPHWIKLYRQIRGIVLTKKIELMMVHHILPVGYAAYFMKKFYKVPYLIFLHGTDFVASQASNRKKKWFLKISLNADQVIANSNSMKKRILALYPQLKDQITVMYPCPDSELAKQSPKKELDKLRAQLAIEGKKVMLTVSRLAEGKGYPLLLRAMPELLDNVPNLVWMIVGDGPKQDALFAEIQERNLQNVVRFIGAVPRRDLKKYYYCADAFVSLTHKDKETGHEEGFGMAFLEAGLTGLPVVAGQSGGVEEAVLNGDTGLVVDAYDTTEVSSAITKIFLDTDYAKGLGDKAKERVLKEFQWEYQLKSLAKWL